MVIKLKFPITGLNMVTLGKLRGSMFNTKFTLEEKSGRLSIIKETKDLIGRKLKLFWQGPMIPQFLGMLPLIQSGSGFGNQFQ